MFEHIKTRPAARIFFLGAVLTLTLLVLIRVFVIPKFQPATEITWSQFGADVTIELFSAVFEATIITSILLWLIPRRDEGGVQEIWGHEIGEGLKKIVADANGNYWFRGRSGRWLRFYVLPKLAAQGSTGKSATVKVHILDPQNETACLQYVDYRNRINRPANDASWTLRRIQIELIATIVSCYGWSAARSTRVEVFVSPSFSLFRLDMSGSAAILTREDPQMPALRIPAGSYLYDSFRYDFSLSEEQARVLPTAKTVPLAETTVESIRNLLKDLKISHDLTAENLTQIVDTVKNPKNPYA